MSKKFDLRLGIISDLHVGFIGHLCPNYYGLSQDPYGSQDKWVEYALRWYKKKGVDAIIVPGDIANACSYDDKTRTWGDYAKMEMARFGAIFQQVFAGTDTKLVAIYGNHDHFCQPREKVNGGEETPWQDAFGETYEHVFVKDVKGYTFVGANWGYEALAKDAVKNAVERSPEKPVFYIQHDVIKDTTCDSIGIERDTAVRGRENVIDYENVIALIGHTHCPITDERTIWQSADPQKGKCTVISCASFNYADSTGDFVRGENLMMKQGLYLTVSGKEINVERYSFFTDEMLALVKGEKRKQNYKKCVKSAGKAWEFSLGGEKVLDISSRAEKAVAPEFPKSAMAGLQTADTYAVVPFPSALPLDREDDIIHSYIVEAWEDESSLLVSTGEISTEFHVNHTGEYFSDYYQVVVGGLKPNTNYTFKVYARDCYGKRSLRPLVRKGKTQEVWSEKLK